MTFRLLRRHQLVLCLVAEDDADQGHPAHDDADQQGHLAEGGGLELGGRSRTMDGEPELDGGAEGDEDH